MTVMAPAKDMFNVLHPPEADPRFLQEMWLIDLEPPNLTFRHTNLNDAVACVQLFLKTRGTHDWHHFMIRRQFFDQFFDLMNKNPSIRVLPFSCCCNGGKHKNSDLRQHRHFIVFCPKGVFTAEVYGKLRLPRDFTPRCKCKVKRDITTPRHLVNTIVYVSRRGSKCRFDGKGTYVKNHYYIFRSLPVDSRLVLMLQWDGGIMEYIHHLHAKLDMEVLIKLPLVNAGHRWHVAVDHLPRTPTRIELPVSDRFAPCPHETPFFVHLVKGKRMYFDVDGPETHLSCAVHDRIKDELWKCPTAYQNSISKFMEMKERIEVLELENLNLRGKEGNGLEGNSNIPAQGFKQNVLRVEEKTERQRLNDEILELKRNIQLLLTENQTAKECVRSMINRVMEQIALKLEGKTVPQSLNNDILELNQIIQLLLKENQIAKQNIRSMIQQVTLQNRTQSGIIRDLVSKCLDEMTRKYTLQQRKIDTQWQIIEQQQQIIEQQGEWMSR